MSLLKEVHHVVVGGGPNLVCRWPRQGGIWHWGDEVLVAYIEAPCQYKQHKEVGHGLEGIWKRGYVRLRRSVDRGLTWSDAGKVFDNSLSVEEQREILRLDDYSFNDVDGPRSPQDREAIDMSSPDAILIMGRAFVGSPRGDGDRRRGQVTYCFRSPDRGHWWERVPSILWPDHSHAVIELANNYLKLGGSRLLCWLVASGAPQHAPDLKVGFVPQLYASVDHGQTWDFYSEIYCDPTGRVDACYPHIVVLPSGTWLCFMGLGYRGVGRRDLWRTAICASEDEGLNWSPPRLIQAWTISPFPLLLDDGRLVVIFMRRDLDPTGLYATVSEDEGRRWAPPLMLRGDTLSSGVLGCVDGGYPVAIQMEDGRILTAYYWQHEDPDVPWYGGRKFIGGTFFELG